MKIRRGVKCYFNKWLTKKKLADLTEIMQEYSKVVNHFIKTFQDQIPQKTKFDLLKREYVRECKDQLNTFITISLIYVAFSEGYDLVKSAKSLATSRKNKLYISPRHVGKVMVLPATICQHIMSISTKLFDYHLYLRCLRDDKNGRYRISIPLKRHVQFNKWASRGKIAKSITLTDKYALFSFEIETGEKKQEGNLIGFDFGVKKLGTLSNEKIIGKDIEKHLYELQRKKRCSKGYYRKKEEIKEYINKEIKDINFNDKQLIVVEKLKNMKYKMKERGRLSKNIRSVFYNLSYRQVLSRIQMLCEENRVSFRSVLPYYTSQECSICGHIEKGNRLSQESFVCQKCGHSDNADLNASKVILKRFTTGLYGAGFQAENKLLVCLK